MYDEKDESDKLQAMKLLSVKAYDKHILMLILILNFLQFFNWRPKYIKVSVDDIFWK